jgi:hypothetical protein
MKFVIYRSGKVALGGANGEVKQKIFGQNFARRHSMDLALAEGKAFPASVAPPRRRAVLS